MQPVAPPKKRINIEIPYDVYRRVNDLDGSLTSHIVDALEMYLAYSAADITVAVAASDVEIHPATADARLS